MPREKNRAIEEAVTKIQEKAYRTWNHVFTRVRRMTAAYNQLVSRHRVTESARTKNSGRIREVL